MFSLAFLVYVSLPAPDFPTPPPDSVQSDEPGDTENPLIRAYFTNYLREETIMHYKKQVSRNVPVLRLNYPPEEAQTKIKDQTRSSYLEELVQPFRMSIFINGFTPTADNDAIGFKGVRYEQKVHVRFIPSSLIARLIIYGFCLFLLYILIYEWGKTLHKMRRK